MTDEELFNRLIQKDLYGIFIYDGNKDKEAVHCPAVNKDGSRNHKVNCSICRRCMHKNVTACYPH